MEKKIYLTLAQGRALIQAESIEIGVSTKPNSEGKNLYRVIAPDGRMYNVESYRYNEWTQREEEFDINGPLCWEFDGSNLRLMNVPLIKKA